MNFLCCRELSKLPLGGSRAYSFISPRISGISFPLHNRAVPGKSTVTITSKQYATKFRVPKKFQRKLLPFETYIPKEETDQIAYQFHNWKIKAFIVSCGGVFLFFALLNSAELLFILLKGMEKNVKNERGEYPWYFWWTYINVDFGATPVRYCIASLLVIVGVATLALSMFYPSRIVREITILKGGKRALIETYGPFGILRDFEVPLKDVTAVWGSEIVEFEKTLPLKVKGKRMFFQISPDRGIIPDAELFNQMIAVKRFEVKGRISFQK